MIHLGLGRGPIVGNYIVIDIATMVTAGSIISSSALLFNLPVASLEKMQRKLYVFLRLSGGLASFASRSYDCWVKLLLDPASGFQGGGACRTDDLSLLCSNLDTGLLSSILLALESSYGAVMLLVAIVNEALPASNMAGPTSLALHS